MSGGRITILGSFDPDFAPHVQVREAIIAAQNAMGVVMNTRWVSPSELEDLSTLEDSRAAIVAPFQIKHSRELQPEVVNAIEWLRMHRVPTLGIEGGFEHMIIEAARNVLGYENATSSVFDDDAPNPVITRFDARATVAGRTVPRYVDIEIHEGTELARIYGQSGVVREAFGANAVFNADYAAETERAGFKLCAHGIFKEQRFIAAGEWNALPYYIGVSYLPQVAGAEKPHPLFTALIEAAQTSDH